MLRKCRFPARPRLPACGTACAGDRPFIRNVLVVALPMVIQQLMTASLHIVDGLMVRLRATRHTCRDAGQPGHIHVQPVPSAPVRAGAIFLSQYWGGRDIRRMRQTMGLTMMFVLIVAAVFMSVSLFDAPSDHIAVSAAGREL